MSEKLQMRLDKIKQNNPDKFESAKRRMEEEWKVTLASTPYYEREVIGDASETALVKFFQPIRDILELRETVSLGKRFDGSESKIVFNSAYKYAMQIFVTPDDPDYSHTAYMKGAPEIVFKKCTSIMVNGQEKPMSEEYKEEFRKANKVFAKNGERVLGFTMMKFPRNKYSGCLLYTSPSPRDS